MKKLLLFLPVIVILLLPLPGLTQVSRDVYYSIPQVYTDPSIVDGEEIQVIGYYTNPDYDLLIDFYGDFIRDSPYSPQTVLTLTGADPPVESWNGGYIRVNGTVSFADVADPYHPEDTVRAYLAVSSVIVIIPAAITPGAPGIERNEQQKGDSGDTRSIENGDCDPCKFAFLLSGGVNADNNHSKYWENLVALYEFKINEQGYCDSNVFVHYYQGTPRDGRIPAGRVRKAEKAKIDSSFQVIADRVAACNDAGTPATFQKMITNHGQSDGDVCLLGTEVLTPEEVKDLQQPIIDSCCRTVYDEFLQCFGGAVVEAVSNLDNKNKATVYANSNADDQCGYSPHGEVHRYLAEKISALTEGDSYPGAVVKAKLAYDDYLRDYIQDIHDYLQYLRAHDTIPDRDQKVAKWVADSAKVANAICKSRNVTIIPFTHYCQWRRIVVPPGGQAVVEFDGNSNSCGNATVYIQDPVTGMITKVRVWNWNHEGSYGYVPGNEQRVINGELTGSTTFWIHNDNDTSRLKINVRGAQVLAESASNVFMYPGFSFGGTDNSSLEFGPIVGPFHFVPMIEMIPLPLQSLPSALGPEGVGNFGFSFQIDPSNALWSDMELKINVGAVMNPGNLQIMSSGSIQQMMVPIPGPGEYNIELGDFTLGDPLGTIQMIAMDGLAMEFDSWGFRTRVQDLPPQVTVWLGESSVVWNDPENWSNGVPGIFHDVIIQPGPFQPLIEADIMIHSVTLAPGAFINTTPGFQITVWGSN